MKAKKQKVLDHPKKEVFILKIYRREENQANSLIGTIEKIGEKEKRAFKTSKELMNWLEVKRST